MSNSIIKFRQYNIVSDQHTVDITQQKPEQKGSLFIQFIITDQTISADINTILLSCHVYFRATKTKHCNLMNCLKNLGFRGRKHGQFCTPVISIFHHGKILGRGRRRGRHCRAEGGGGVWTGSRNLLRVVEIVETQLEAG